MNTAISRNIEQVTVVAEIVGRIAPGPDRAALTVKAGLRTKRGVFVECFGPVVGVEHEREVVVPYIAAGSIYGFKRKASTVAKAGTDFPASLLLEGCGAG